MALFVVERAERDFISLISPILMGMSIKIMSQEFHACLSSYIVFGVLFGGPFALWLWILLVKGNIVDWWKLGAILMVGWVCVYFWLSRFLLVIDSNPVSYSSLFTRR